MEKKNAIKIDGLSFAYDGVNKILDNISLDIKEGEFVAILGHNGSGKTTLARHFNCLVDLQEGSLEVAGLDANDKKNLYEIRKRCGMVFQNPDNQFVSSIVEEDMAFGPTNFGIDKKEIPGIIRRALELVGMSRYEKSSVYELSGGQKQRVAIAGVLASDPEILVFDEVTNMLDPQGKRVVLQIMDNLHAMNKSVVMITHVMEEAALADRIIVLKDGKIIADGKTKDILTNQKLMQETRLAPPSAVQVYYELKAKGVELDDCPLTNEELADLIVKKINE